MGKLNLVSVFPQEIVVRHELSSEPFAFDRLNPKATPSSVKPNRFYGSGRFGREVRLQRSPREGPECMPKPPFHCEREVRFTALSRRAYSCYGLVGYRPATPEDRRRRRRPRKRHLAN